MGLDFPLERLAEWSYEETVTSVPISHNIQISFNGYVYGNKSPFFLPYASLQP